MKKFEVDYEALNVSTHFKIFSCQMVQKLMLRILSR